MVLVNFSVFVCVRACVRACMWFVLWVWFSGLTLFRLSFREHYWYAKLSLIISRLTALIVIETLFVRLERHNNTRHSYSVHMNIASAESTICNLLGHVLDNFSMVLFNFVILCFFPHFQMVSVNCVCKYFPQANRTDREEPNNVLVSVWFPNGLASRCKSTQLCKMRTCEVWPNGFASRLASSRKSQKAVNFTHIQLICDQLVLTCVGWPNGQKLASLRANLSSTALHPKWAPVRMQRRLIWAPPRSTPRHRKGRKLALFDGPKEKRIVKALEETNSGIHLVVMSDVDLRVTQSWRNVWKIQGVQHFLLKWKRNNWVPSDIPTL